MKLNNRYPIVVLILLCICCIGVWMYMSADEGGEKIAEIMSFGEFVDRVDLSEAEKPYEFEVKTDAGYNRIRIEQGRIAVIEADCPDKVCVNQGYITNGALPIVCLPHKLSIIIKASYAEIDAVTGK